MFAAKTVRTLFVAIFVAAIAMPVFAGAEVVIKVATLAPGNSAWVKVFEAAAKEIKDKTGGQVVFKIYAGGKRGDEKVVINKMKSDQLQGAAITSVGLALIAKEVLVLQTPGVIDNYEQLDYVRGKLEPQFRATFEKAGYILLGWGDTGYAYLFSKNAIRTKADLRNAKPWLWSEDPLFAEGYKLVGATPTPLAVPDVLQNLTTGVVESFYASPLIAIALQWFQHTKYITNMKLAVGVGATVMTKKAWDQVSAEHQKVVLQVFDEWHKVLIAKVRKDNARAVQTLKKRGLEIVDLDDAQKADWNKTFDEVQKALVGRIYPQSLLDEVRRLAKQAK